MLKLQDVLAMGKALKLDEAKLKEAFENKVEVDFEVKTDDLVVMTVQERTQREESLKRTHEKAGSEIAIKNMRETLQLDFEGKTEDKFIEAFKAKVLKDANINESEKVAELNKTIEGLRTNIQTLKSENEGIITKQKAAQLDSQILSWVIDKKPDNLTNEEFLAIVKMNNEIYEENGQLFVKRDGKPVQDPTTLSNIPAKDAVVKYIDERKIGKDASGAGFVGRNGPDSSGAALGIRNMKQFNEHLQSKGINAGSQQAAALLNEITAQVKDFDFTPA